MSNKPNGNSQVSKEQLMTVQYEVDGHDIKLSPSIVKNYIANNQNVTDQEYKFFVEMCQARKLNPFLKEAYLIKFGSNTAQIVVGKDAILKRAVTHPKFNGREQGIIVLNTEGEVIERKGTFKLSNEQLVGGWAKVYRKDWEYPVEVTVSFDEVAQKKVDGSLNSNWANKGGTMVEKVALVRALREAFVEDLSGMIDKDEAWTEDVNNEPQTSKSSRKTTQEVIDQPEPEFIKAEVVEKEMSLDDL